MQDLCAVPTVAASLTGNQKSVADFLPATGETGTA
nr:MAG TPA: hypothetical protein [Caudoviricetes sp.]